MFQGTYVGVWRGDEVVGAVAHNWNGDLHVECPVDLDEASRFAVATTGRDVRGFLGAWDQCRAARTAVGLDENPPAMISREDLFALDLHGLRIPSALENREVTCRLATMGDVDDLLTVWRLDYQVETLGGTPSEKLRERGREMLQSGVETDSLFVLERDAQIIAMSAFNAALPDCVQIGGVFTPPPLRSRGYGRCVVAGSLLHARANGVTRSILFTEEENAPAQTAYTALGYDRVGEYGLILYDK